MGKKQPIFLATEDRETFNDEDIQNLSDCGLKVFFLKDPRNVQVGVPIAPIIPPADTISRCLLKAVQHSDAATKKFSELLLKEIAANPHHE